MHTLIIYELRPEEVKLYLVPNQVITKRHRELLELAHNSMMNADDFNEGMAFLCNALADQVKYCLDEAPEGDKCVWAGYLHDIHKPITATIDHVYYSGYFL
jgi:hypothetical protein